MKIIGVTGNIASGKSTVSRIIAENFLDCPLISVDDFSKGYISTYPLLIQECFKPFGLRCYPDTLVDNIKESFGVRPFREYLQQIIGAAFWRYMQYDAVQKHQVVVVEHPIMFEVGDENKFDYIIGVTADYAARLNRMRNRGYDSSTIRQRIAAQIPLDKNIDKIGHIIDTTQLPSPQDVIRDLQNSRSFKGFLSEASIPQFSSY